MKIILSDKEMYAFAKLLRSIELYDAADQFMTSNAEKGFYTREYIKADEIQYTIEEKYIDLVMDQYGKWIPLMFSAMKSAVITCMTAFESMGQEYSKYLESIENKEEKEEKDIKKPSKRRLIIKP